MRKEERRGGRHRAEGRGQGTGSEGGEGNGTGQAMLSDPRGQGGWSGPWPGLSHPPTQRGEGGWHKASVSDCLPLAAPIGLSPLLILTLCGPKRVLVVSTEPPDDWSCLTTPGVRRPGDGAVARAIDQVHPDAHSVSMRGFADNWGGGVPVPYTHNHMQIEKPPFRSRAPIWLEACC